jgi:hypothetical protein
VLLLNNDLRTTPDIYTLTSAEVIAVRKPYDREFFPRVFPACFGYWDNPSTCFCYLLSRQKHHAFIKFEL